MADKKLTPTTEPHRWTGATIHRNILDQMENPVPVYRLFMVRKGTEEKWFENINTETGYAENIPTSIKASSDMVVLSQTGVTGTQVDDIVIAQAFTETSGTISVSFRVSEPGAASFIDQIQLSKAFLGHDPGPEVYFFLDISFKGYDSDGNAVTIGPHRWYLGIKSLEVNVTDQGSEYEFSAYTPSLMVTEDPTLWTLPTKISGLKGNTITKYLKDLSDKLNKEHEKDATHPDTITFDTSLLVGSAGSESTLMIKDESTVGSASTKGDASNRVRMTLANQIKSEEVKEKQKQLEEYGGAGFAEPVFEDDSLVFAKGTSMTQVISTLLSMNPEMYSKITRLKDPSDTESEMDLNRATTTWFKTLVEVKYGKIDYKRKVRAKHITIKPYLFETARVNTSYATGEHDINEEQAASRLTQLLPMIKKSYDYMFTGMNTDISDFSIRYENALAVMHPSRGGMLGKVEVAQSNVTAAQVDSTDAVSTEDQNNKVSQTEKAKKRSGILQALQDLAGIADQAGADLDSILDRYAAGNELNAELLKKAVQTGEVSDTINLLVDADLDTVIPTTDSDLAPEQAVIYGADLVDDPNNRLSAEQLMELGLQKVDAEAVKAQQSTTPSNKYTSITDVGTEASTIAGDPKNTLFGNYADQIGSNKHMMRLTLSLRGDPWYLGAGSEPLVTENSNLYRGSFGRHDQYFWLTIRAPQRYDYDVDDEDNNTGYWRFDNTNKMFTGLYGMIKVIHTFSNGKYDCEIEAAKTCLDATKVPEGTTAKEQPAQKSAPAGVPTTTTTKTANPDIPGVDTIPTQQFTDSDTYDDPDALGVSTAGIRYFEEPYTPGFNDGSLGYD